MTVLTIACSLKSLNYNLILRHLLCSGLQTSFTLNASWYQLLKVDLLQHSFWCPARIHFGPLLFIHYNANIVDIVISMVYLYTSTLTIHNSTPNSLPNTLLMLSLAYWLVSLIYNHGVHLSV